MIDFPISIHLRLSLFYCLFVFFFACFASSWIIFIF